MGAINPIEQAFEGGERVELQSPTTVKHGGVTKELPTGTAVTIVGQPKKNKVVINCRGWVGSVHPSALRYVESAAAVKALTPEPPVVVAPASSTPTCTLTSKSGKTVAADKRERPGRKPRPMQEGRNMDFPTTAEIEATKNALTLESQSSQEIATSSQVPILKVISALTLLEIQGRAKQVGDNRYVNMPSMFQGNPLTPPAYASGDKVKLVRAMTFKARGRSVELPAGTVATVAAEFGDDKLTLNHKGMVARGKAGDVAIAGDTPAPATKPVEAKLTTLKVFDTPKGLCAKFSAIVMPGRKYRFYVAEITDTDPKYNYKRNFLQPSEYQGTCYMTSQFQVGMLYEVANSPNGAQEFITPVEITDDTFVVRTLGQKETLAAARNGGRIPEKTKSENVDTQVPNPPKISLVTSKEDWEMTLAEYLQLVGYKKAHGSRSLENWRGQHEGIVMLAKMHGKPVPANVLAEYPARPRTDMAGKASNPGLACPHCANPIGNRRIKPGVYHCSGCGGAVTAKAV